MQFYRKPTDDSNTLRTLINLFKTWNEPEKAEQWRAKLPQRDDDK